MSEPGIRINAVEIEKLARLAGLTVQEEIVPSLIESMRVMLQNFAVLQEVAGPGGTQHPTEALLGLNDARRDTPRLDTDIEALCQSKDFEENLFFVPKILD